ncbi:MAG: hypothetical protein ACLFQA_07580 [Bacteroidales bacterium]
MSEIDFITNIRGGAAGSFMTIAVDVNRTLISDIFPVLEKG